MSTIKNKVLKFGGTSMSDANSIRKVAEIIKADNSNKIIVVSAPGKRNKTDIKVTDLLYSCFKEVEDSGNCKDSFSLIRKRFLDIVSDLKMDFDITPYLDSMEKEMSSKKSTISFCASRGEYLSALILAKYLSYKFIDAKELIHFDRSGGFDAKKTNKTIKNKLKGKTNIVVPGFYGSNSKGKVVTFSRGGSDITGAVLAKGIDADIYENWTDVDGFMMADPRIVENPLPIKILSYRELRELAYMGANVLHPASVFPVREQSIPINIRNTFNPQYPGTFIVDNYEVEDEEVITGIAGKKGFWIIYIEKSMMNNELGFARKVLSALEYYQIPFEHMPTGIDTLCVSIAEKEIQGKEKDVVKLIKKTVEPDKIEIIKDIAFIATVGKGMSRRVGTAATLFTALKNNNVNVRLIDQGSSELNIIVGVDIKDYDTAIKAIYDAFVINHNKKA